MFKVNRNNHFQMKKTQTEIRNNNQIVEKWKVWTNGRIWIMIDERQLCLNETWHFKSIDEYLNWLVFNVFSAIVTKLNGKIQTKVKCENIWQKNI